MNTTGIDTTKAALIMGVSALAILLSGCQSVETAPLVTYTSSPAPAQAGKDPAPGSPQKTYSEQTENELQTDEPGLNRADTARNTSAETSAIQKTDDTKAAVKTQSEEASWSAAAPKLQGIAIGDTLAAVTQLYGKPIDSYTLDEENDAITVLEYDGFAVGINEYKKVQYVEVYSKSISAGLNGLRIGDEPEAALRALGKPGKQTAYLLIYEADGAMLKLDLDPEHNEIVSIKLLSPG